MSKHNSGWHYIKVAEKAGLKVESGKGDHAKVIGPAGRGYMIIPVHRELSTSTRSGYISSGSLEQLRFRLDLEL